MSITTKGGDKGETIILSGEHVSKSDVRVEALGTGDELVSNIGELKFFVPEYTEILVRIQKNIFRINSHCADATGTKYLLDSAEIDAIEQFIEEGESRLSLNGFIIPSENRAAAKCDVTRTVCRRFERRLISLTACGNVDAAVLKYINRLSDFLYIMARLVGKEYLK